MKEIDLFTACKVFFWSVREKTLEDDIHCRRRERRESHNYNSVDSTFVKLIVYTFIYNI